MALSIAIVASDVALVACVVATLGFSIRAVVMKPLLLRVARFVLRIAFSITVRVGIVKAAILLALPLRHWVFTAPCLHSVPLEPALGRCVRAGTVWPVLGAVIAFNNALAPLSGCHKIEILSGSFVEDVVSEAAHLRSHLLLRFKVMAAHLGSDQIQIELFFRLLNF